MEQESFQELLRSPVVQLAAPLVTGLIGFILGHRLAIGRDRRNEYNAIADQVRSRLIRMRGAHCSCIADISESDWDLLYRRAGRIQAARLRKALQCTKEAEKSGSAPDALNQAVFTDPAAMTAERERLIDLLKHR